MNRSIIRRLVGLGATLFILATGAHAQGQVPVEAFFTPPAMRSVAPSPNGRWLAAVAAPKGETARLIVIDTQDKEPARTVAMFAKLDVSGVRWVNDDWLVFGTLDLVNKASDWDRMGRGLLAVTRTGERMRVLIKREFDNMFPAGGPKPLEGNHFLMGLGAPGTNEIIVGENRWDGGYEFSHVLPIALDVATGARRVLVERPPADVSGWVFDIKGQPRAAVSQKNDKWSVHWLEPSGTWKVIGTFDVLMAGLSPAFIDESGQLFMEHLDDKGYMAISRFDLATGKLASQPLISTPGFSGEIGLMQSRIDGSLRSVSVVTDARSQVWLTPEMKAIQAKVDAKLAGRVNLLRCGTCDAPETVVVASYADRLPVEFLLYRPKSDQWQRLGSSRPDIEPQRMARKELHRFKARDGLEVPVWVTRPAGADVKPLPAVMLVHGGPWSRGGEWEWEPEAQFLASRGYVVIEPEFRGSTGFGSSHYEAGWKQWGQAMQDDLSDALKFTVQRGWVDARRVCIAGASYGGYATLMGLAKDPEQYRCGVAWVGVSDLMLRYTAHWSSTSRDSKEHILPKLLGDPVKDAAMLKANSPVERAASIKAPVMLAYGGRDRRVPIEHGTRMREALRKAGNEPEWVVYDDEEHGFFRPENQIDFWKRVEAFFGKHLK